MLFIAALLFFVAPIVAVFVGASLTSGSNGAGGWFGIMAIFPCWLIAALLFVVALVRIGSPPPESGQDDSPQ